MSGKKITLRSLVSGFLSNLPVVLSCLVLISVLRENILLFYVRSSYYMPTSNTFRQFCVMMTRVPSGEYNSSWVCVG